MNMRCTGDIPINSNIEEIDTILFRRHADSEGNRILNIVY